VPPLLFGRHASSECPFGSTFVTFALPGYFAGMLLNLKELYVLPSVLLC
jgi:hypothetical protein